MRFFVATIVTNDPMNPVNIQFKELSQSSTGSFVGLQYVTVGTAPPTKLSELAAFYEYNRDRTPTGKLHLSGPAWDTANAETVVLLTALNADGYSVSYNG
jgi:hypothetical protein